MKKTSLNLRFRIGKESDLWKRLHESAEKDDRSLNSEILRRLERSFAEQDLDTTLERLADKVVARMKSDVVA